MKKRSFSISRRKFIRECAACGLGTAVASSWVDVAFARAPGPNQEIPPVESLKEALFWEPLDNGRTRCTTCPNMCERDEGGITLCKTRINRGGKLYTLTYGKPCMLCVDPLSKNPLYHVDPGSNAIGVATAGCNLSCKYCQNWDIALVGPWRTKNIDVSPVELVRKVTDRNLKWLTFSYTEPTAYYEYAVDTAKLAKGKGVNVAVCTAGFICEHPLQELMKYVDAFSVTLKGYTQEFYKDVCGCNLDDVWKTIRAIFRSKRWLEVVTLIVPGLNDEDDGLRSIVRSLAGLSRDIPLHFLRFAPAYKLKHLQPTPLKTLERAHSIALKEGLGYVYIDLSGHQAANTYCPGCKRAVIERAGFAVVSNHLRNGQCSYCSTRIRGIFSSDLP